MANSVSVTLAQKSTEKVRIPQMTMKKPRGFKNLSLKGDWITSIANPTVFAVV